LDKYVAKSNFTCLEQAFFLRAYAYYKSVAKTDSARLMKAGQLFQDALVFNPGSPLVPFAYAAMGMIQEDLNNGAAAEGYFNIIKQGYPEYRGMPEIIYHLARLYEQQGHFDKAMRYYKRVFEDETQNKYIADAGIGYGKALFRKMQYFNSLAVLNYVVKSSPRKVYSSPELLLAIGNANFEVGLAKESRKALTRVLNLFSDIKNPDVILSRIADTYGMENNRTRAVKLYELVRTKFPDSEGFIASSIGIARYMKDNKEKIKIYEMIKRKFPDNKYARIAMMRLAEIYQADGKYNECIKEIEDLLSTHPRGLRYEAVKLMQKAYEALFKKQLQNNEFTKVLNRYESEHTRIDRMGSRKIELLVGLSYLQAKLYEQAFNHLITAYKGYKRSKRSARLLLGLGIAMDESGRDDDALRLFNVFARRVKSSINMRVEALSRAGRIYLEKHKFAKASARLKLAYDIAKTHLEKGRLLILRADVYEGKKDIKTASVLMERAVRQIAMASGKNYDILSDAYEKLGRSYALLRQYIKAADAFSKALNFAGSEQKKANLGFLLGDAYQKGNIIMEAKKAFRQVAESYDSIWARLAQQRLNTLDLAQAVKKS